MYEKLNPKSSIYGLILPIVICFIMCQYAHSQSLPLSWDTRGLVNCDDDGILSITEDGRVLDISGFEGANCLQCEELNPEGDCESTNEDNMCSDEPGFLFASVDVSQFSSYTVELTFIASDVSDCGPCSSSDLAIVNISSSVKGSLLDYVSCGPEVFTSVFSEDSDSCVNETLVFVLGLKSNTDIESYHAEINVVGIGEELKPSISDLAIDLSFTGCRSDPIIINPVIEGFPDLEYTLISPMGDILPDLTITVPDQIPVEGIVYDLEIRNDCGVLSSFPIFDLNNSLFEQCDLVQDDFEDFSAYPWLLDLYPDCDNISFQEYNNGSFSFIYVSDGTLLFEDGTLYCRDRENLNCRETYGLLPSGITNRWQCAETTIVDGRTTAVELNVENTSVDQGAELCLDITSSEIKDLLSFQLEFEFSNQNLQVSDVFSVEFPSATLLPSDKGVKVIWFSEQLNPIDLAAGATLFTICVNAIDAVDAETNVLLKNTERLFPQFVTEGDDSPFYEITDISFSGGAIDIIEREIETEIEENSMLPIDVFPWISVAIEEFNCEDLLVAEYNVGAFSYVYLQDQSGARLFFEDGSVLCRSADDRDCRDLYGLSADQISNEWTCQEEGQGEVEEEVEEEEEQEDGSLSPDAVEQYPWLEDIISCDTNEGIVEYGSGIFSFIYVESSLTLYFEDGTFYCSGSETVDCRELYDLTEIKNEWTCEGSLQNSKIESREFNEIKNELIIYPNPSRGQFVIENNNEILNYLVTDLIGNIIINQKSNPQKNIQIDLSEEANGIYLFIAKTADQQIPLRIIKF